MYICKNCGNEFEEKYSKWSDGNFCCKECARSYSSQQSYKTKICQCIVCGTDVEVNCHKSKKFVRCEKCSHEFLRQRKNAEYNNRQKRNAKISNKFCLNCGNPIPSYRTFCSSVCSRKYQHKLKMQEVADKNGVGCHFPRIKDYLKETRGHKCEICGNTEWMGQPIPLVLDHINGRASDDRLENLRLVCGNCDMQLPTYKSKNKNSDRKRVGKYI